MIEFNGLKEVYFTRLKPFSIAGLAGPEIEDMLKDGRFVSPILEKKIGKEFANLTKLNANNNSDHNWDLHLPIEQRVMSWGHKSRQVLLSPSKDIGTQRSFSSDSFQSKLDAISGFMLVYQFPQSVYDMALIFMPVNTLQSKFCSKAKLSKTDVMEGLLETQENVLYSRLMDNATKQDGAIIPDKMYALNKEQVKLAYKVL